MAALTIAIVSLSLLVHLPQTPQGDDGRLGKGQFGVSIEAYQIRPGLLVTVKRDDKGRVAEVVVVPATVAGNVAGGAGSLDERTVAELIDQLAPPAERGGKAIPRYGTFAFLGDGEVRDYSYDNVEILLCILPHYCGESFLTMKWKRP
jgi:hypothetical protein